MIKLLESSDELDSHSNELMIESLVKLLEGCKLNVWYTMYKNLQLQLNNTLPTGHVTSQRPTSLQLTCTPLLAHSLKYAAMALHTASLLPP